VAALTLGEYVPIPIDMKLGWCQKQSSSSHNFNCKSYKLAASVCWQYLGLEVDPTLQRNLLPPVLWLRKALNLLGENMLWL